MLERVRFLLLILAFFIVGLLARARMVLITRRSGSCGNLQLDLETLLSSPHCKPRRMFLLGRRGTRYTKRFNKRNTIALIKLMFQSLEEEILRRG